MMSLAVFQQSDKRPEVLFLGSVGHPELSKAVEVVCCLSRLGLMGVMTFDIDIFCDSSQN